MVSGSGHTEGEGVPEGVLVANSVTNGNEAELAQTGDYEAQRGHIHLSAEPPARDGTLLSNSVGHEHGEELARPGDQEEARSGDGDPSAQPSLPEGATLSHFVTYEHATQVAPSQINEDESRDNHGIVRLQEGSRDINATAEPALPDGAPSSHLVTAESGDEAQDSQRDVQPQAVMSSKIRLNIPFTLGQRHDCTLDAVYLNEHEENELRIWSIDHICDERLQLPKICTAGHRISKDWTFFSEDPATVLLPNLFKYDAPPQSVLQSLLELAPSALLANHQSIRLPSSPETRFPLKAIGAWQLCHLAPEAKALWMKCELWVIREQNAGRLTSTEVEQHVEYMMSVPWAGSMKHLHDGRMFKELAPLLSDSMLNDVVIDAMLSIIVATMRTDDHCPGKLCGIAHTPFGQALSQMELDYRQNYPTHGQSILLETGDAFEKNDDVQLYGVINTGRSHWATFCVSKKSGKVVVGWADPLQLPMPPILLRALKTWLNHHCVGLSVEVDNGMMEHGVQTDVVSCGVVAINALSHLFLDEQLWTPAKRSSIRLAEFEKIVSYSTVRLLASCLKNYDSYFLYL